METESVEQVEVASGDFNKLNTKSSETRFGFPWRALMLCVVRMGLCYFFFKIGSSQMVVRTDGSTSNKRPFKQSRAHYRYEEMNVMLSVLLMDVFPDRVSIALAGLSSLTLLASILMNSLKKQGVTQKDSFSDGEPVFPGYLPQVIASMAVFSVTLIAIDFIDKIPAALTYVHNLLLNVGHAETLAYFMCFTSLHVLQFYLLFGGIDFVKCLLSEEVSRQTT